MSANLSAITSIFELADLTPYERVTLIYLRTLSLEHTSVFPSYEKIAQKCGMVRRTAINVVKRLVELGLVTKEHRFNPDKPANAPKAERQQSNEYSVQQSSDSPAESATNEVMPSNSPVLNAFKNVSKTEEEEYINTARDLANIPYFPFENEIKRQKITPEIRNAILEQIAASGSDIWHYSAEAIRRALKKATNRMRLGSGLYNPPKWIASAIRNEQMNLDLAGA